MSETTFPLAIQHDKQCEQPRGELLAHPCNCGPRAIADLRARLDRAEEMLADALLREVLEPFALVGQDMESDEAAVTLTAAREQWQEAAHALAIREGREGDRVRGGGTRRAASKAARGKLSRVRRRRRPERGARDVSDRRGIIVRGSFRSTTDRVEVLWIGGGCPYLRFGLPDEEPQREYIGCIEGRDSLRKLRDLITRKLRKPRK